MINQKIKDYLDFLNNFDKDENFTKILSKVNNYPVGSTGAEKALLDVNLYIYNNFSEKLNSFTTDSDFLSLSSSDKARIIKDYLSESAKVAFDLSSKITGDYFKEFFKNEGVLTLIDYPVFDDNKLNGVIGSILRKSFQNKKFTEGMNELSMALPSFSKDGYFGVIKNSGERFFKSTGNNLKYKVVSNNNSCDYCKSYNGDLYRLNNDNNKGIHFHNGCRCQIKVYV